MVDDNQAMTTHPGPPDYGPESIHPLRPPEIEEEAPGTRWRSRWLLRLEAPVDRPALPALATHLSTPDPVVTVELSPLTDHTVRLDLSLPVHPLDVEAYPLIDKVLLAIDATLGGIAEINDSPRNWWRTFRTRPNPDPGP
jgi:hypothetical protein